MNTQVIGYVGENGTRDVQIPVGHLLEKWPDLSPSILMVPVGGADDDAYPVDSELVGSDLVWHVSAADTAVTGTTKASVRMTASDGRVALDEPFTVIVSQNLSAGGAPPSPIQPWVDKLAELAPRAEKAADDAAKAADRANAAANNWESGTAANADKLGGNPPEYYIRSVNLLDNSNFRNPVNQRGQTSYTASGYTIDRWRIWDGGSVTVNDGYITIGSNTVFQYIQLSSLKNMEHTLAIKRLDGTITLVVNNPRNAYLWSSGVGLGTDDNNLAIVSVDSSDVVWAALYEGSYTAETLPPYVPKGYNAELDACHERFHRFDDPYSFVAAGFFDKKGAYAYLAIDTPYLNGDAKATVTGKVHLSYPATVGDDSPVTSTILSGAAAHDGKIRLQCNLDTANPALANMPCAIQILAGDYLEISRDL